MPMRHLPRLALCRRRGLDGRLAVLARAPWPSGRHCLHLSVAGIGIQALYLAGCGCRSGTGSAGMAALIVNLQPVLAALAPLVGE